MRNLFDQYRQAENRITHALAIVLNEDRLLLSQFLRNVLCVQPPCRISELNLAEQRYPGEPEQSEEEAERRGIPDLWIFNVQHSWCVFIENKVQSVLRADQIERHRGIATRLGFRTAIAVAITVDVPDRFQCDCTVIEWRRVFQWLCSVRQNQWANRLKHYLEVVEGEMVAAEQPIRGTLTMFAGVPFGQDQSFTYLEGKRILGLALEELRKRKDLHRELKIDPTGLGRPAITGSNSKRVWDFIPLVEAQHAKTFTEYPHLTLGIDDESVGAMVTIPDSVNRKMRRSLVELQPNGFHFMIKSIVRRMQPLLRKQPGAKPWFRGIQRRFLGRRTQLVDAQVECDLRTAFPSAGPPKTQPAWLAAGFEAFVKKKGNYQIQVGVLFPLADCPKMKTPQATDLIAQAWIACKPLIDLQRR